MSVLQEIYRWSTEIPDWQSDALRRLLSKGALSSEKWSEQSTAQFRSYLEVVSGQIFRMAEVGVLNEWQELTAST